MTTGLAQLVKKPLLLKVRYDDSIILSLILSCGIKISNCDFLVENVLKFFYSEGPCDLLYVLSDL